MNLTAKGLKKPDETEAYDINIQNENMELIDQLLDDKLDVDDVVDNLETSNDKKALSANQGKQLANIIGKLTNLTTRVKTSIVNALNGLQADIGDVSELEDPETENVVEAVNKVKSDLGTHLAESATHIKPARFVIGTSTSGWTEKDCHYLCDGTADNVEINNAISNLPVSGGEIVILDGTYNITAPILIEEQENVILRGAGAILKRMWDSVPDTGLEDMEGLILLKESIGCKIIDFTIDGNKSSYDSSNRNYGIFLYASNNCTVTSNICSNNSDKGIYLRDVSDSIISSNICNNNSNNGIEIYNDCQNNTISGNVCNNNSIGIVAQFTSSGKDYLGNNIISGNTCNNNSTGMRLFVVKKNTIVGNICIRNKGREEDYGENDYTIFIGSGDYSEYNIITNNNCMGKAVVVGLSRYNTIENNKYN